ncbi:hypothetical protein ACQEU8_03865 [Streptomyces sp. CA-250714]|uniref:hypothetical protein n=1 Tax=Streptomyces sp. CA-250714 TaxID=3240060 RepID=UPI003D937AA8
MPNPALDDLRLSHAYLLWVRQAPEQRRETLPDREVEVTVPAMAPYPEEVVKLGEELHSFLNPANPGAGDNLVEALSTGGVPVDNVEGLGWHIHPGILNEDQLAKWTDSTDLREAGWIHQLYEEERATRGYVPVKIGSEKANKKRKIVEPGWSLETRKIMYRSRTGEHAFGPAAAWALIDNEIPVKSALARGRVRITREAPLDSERAARERGEMLGRNIRALYDWGMIPSGHLPSSDPRGKVWPEWVRRTIRRITVLATESDPVATSEKPEIAALEESGGLTLKPAKSGKGDKISTDNVPIHPIREILKKVKQLPPGVREYGPDGPPQQAAPGAAEPAPPLGASFGQPPASPSFHPSAPPFPLTFPQNPTWAEATRAFSPPVAGGSQNPSSAGQADMPSRAADQQQGPQPKKMRK